MASSGNPRPGLLMLSPTTYPLGHMPPYTLNLIYSLNATQLSIVVKNVIYDLIYKGQTSLLHLNLNMS